ncbi:MAG TPA: hypothetical protein VF808_12295 [Ktedonobacterales bacterium]
MSADGGVTWRLADRGLVAAGQGLWDYAATASGATVFAITEPLSTKPTNMGPTPPLILWRSDDAGATWTRPGALPHAYVGKMRAAMVGGTPVLYLQTFDDPSHSYIQAGPWGASGSWLTAPASGPSGPLAQNFPVLTTMPDGSLLIDSGGILAWRWSARPGGWRQIAADPRLTSSIKSAFIVTTASGQQLWLEGSTESMSDVVEYSTLLT